MLFWGNAEFCSNPHMWHNFLHKPVLQLLSWKYTIYLPVHCRSVHTWDPLCSRRLKFPVSAIPTNTFVIILGESKRIFLTPKALGSLNSSFSSNDLDFHHYLSHSFPWSCPEILSGLNFNSLALRTSIWCFQLALNSSGSFRCYDPLVLQAFHYLCP